MFVTLKHSRTRRRVIPRFRRLLLESLEPRCVLAAKILPESLPEPFDLEPNDTADRAQIINVQDVSGEIAIRGTIGSSADDSDVDWFSFKLDKPSTVRLASTGPISTGLYVSAPFDADRFAQSGIRLIKRVESNNWQQTLAAGEYQIAVSGAGNDAFHPFLANSGLDGATGDYQLQISTDPLAVDPTDGPIVISAEPADHATFDDAPFVLRYTLSSSLNPDSAIAGETVRLIYNPVGDFGDDNDQDIALDAIDFSAASGEIQLSPTGALASGFYQVVFLGNITDNFSVLTDMNGVPFGTNAQHPQGQDARFSFQVTGIEGNRDLDAIPDDTSMGAHELGELTSNSLMQQFGAIGDDPRYPLRNADVDLYHFQLAGPDHYAVVAEVFARRMGSPLDSGVSLFRQDPSDGHLVLIAGNDNTLNDAPATNGKTVPLLSDSLVSAGLTAGDYYVAVSSRGNVPDAARGVLPGIDGIFDPNVSLSGLAGLSYGPYVLNILARADNAPPLVVGVSEDGGPGAAPTQIVVRFSEPVNLRELALSAFEQSGEAALAPVFIETPDHQRVYPRLLRFDDASNEATFQMLDRLPLGTSTLHLSGTLGLADFAGNALASNAGNGEFTTPVIVDVAAAETKQGANGYWVSQEPNDDESTPQEIGVLFPRELQVGVVIRREGSAQDRADTYRIKFLQDQTYFFFVTGPAGLQLTLIADGGNVVPISAQGTDGHLALITAGTYTLTVTGWSSAQARETDYELRITLGGNRENPPPLTNGPAPLLRSRLSLAPPAESLPPQINLPITPTPSGISSNPPSAERETRSASTPQIVLSSVPNASTTTATIHLPSLSVSFISLAAGPMGGFPGPVAFTGNLGNVAIDRVEFFRPATTSSNGIAPASSLSAPSGYLALANPGVGINFAMLIRGLSESQRLLHHLWTNTLDRIFTPADPDDESGDELDDERTSELDSYEKCSLPLMLGGAIGMSLLLGKSQKKVPKSHWHLRRNAPGSHGDEFVDSCCNIR